MKNIFKKIIPFICLLFVILSMAAVSKQIMGPTAAVTDNAIVRWDGTSGWKATNSIVVIDDLGNITGINSQTVQTMNSSTGTVTNGIVYLMKTGAPTASEVGGTVGVSTNFMVRNVNGALISYWSDGTTLYSKTLAP